MAVTWDSGHAGTGIVLAGGNLIATAPVTAGIVLCTVSLPASGKTYAEFTVIPDTGNTPAIGVALVGQNLNSYMGDSTNSEGYYCGAGGGTPFTGFNNSFPAGGPPVPSSGQIVGSAVDTVNGGIYWQTNGGSWNGTGANPATNTGGFAISVVGTIFFAIYLSGVAQVTGNFGATTPTFSIPAGFSMLDSGDVLMPQIVMRRPLFQIPRFFFPATVH